MQITHEYARELIQFRLDSPLSSDKRIQLDAHLEVCIECQDYAREVMGLESVLRVTMNRHWALDPLPLSMDAMLQRPSGVKNSRAITLATRFAILGIIFAMFSFSMLKLGILKQPEVSGAPIPLLPNPTPSLHATNTDVNLQTCKTMVYVVQPSDTLESIALLFAIDEEIILKTNNLASRILSPGMKLVIPTCENTPTITANPPVLTTTLTPLIQLTSYTPGQ